MLGRVLIFTSLAIFSSSALYFHIAETEKKCFIEELADETRVIGNFKVQLYDPSTKGYGDDLNIGMHVEVKDPKKKVILSKLYPSEGRFTFTSHTPGEHLICLYSNSTRWFASGQLRVHLGFKVGEHAIDYEWVASKDKLNEIQLRFRQLLDQVEQINKEQYYQRYREERFRQTSESTNSRVLWWAVAQTLVLVVIGAWQMYHLKGFFKTKTKKLVRTLVLVFIFASWVIYLLEFAMNYEKDTSFQNGWLRSSTNFYQQHLKWIVIGAMLLISLLFIVMIYLYRYTILLAVFPRYNQTGVHTDSKEKDPSNPLLNGNNATINPVLMANQYM